MKRLLLMMVLTASVSLAGEVRYLSAAGDDAADGRTPQSAWRTVEKLNAGLPVGGTALLRRGDVFYGGLRLPAGADASHPTVLADYGTGPKPVLSSVKIIRPDPSIWKGPSHSRWWVNLADPTNYTGIVTQDCNPGFLLVDGKIKAWKRYCHDDVVMPWDFCGEDGWLHVHAPKNPALLAKDIRVALNVHNVIFQSHTVISNIAVRATGAHGMYGGWKADSICEDVRISDCDFENIGGSELLNYSAKTRVRYGNGVEFGSNCRNAVVERCTFKGTYDVAVTMQGHPTLTSWSDIHIRNCTMTDCTQAFEVWCGKAPKGMGFERCSFTGNRTVRVGGGWGPVVRPMRECATPLLVYGMDTDTVDITVSGNTFEDAPRGLLFKSGGLDKMPAGYRIQDNVLRSAGVYKLRIDNVPETAFNRTPASATGGLYAKGERPQFKVSATLDGRPAAGGTVALTVAAPGRFPAQEVEVKLDEKGEAKYSAEAPSAPGWVFVTGRIGSAKASGGAMCDKDAIRASAPPPDDFKAFWDAEIAALRKVPMKAKLTAVPTQEGLKDKVDTWEFEITCAGPRPSTGYISLPKGAKPKSLPIIVGFNGAGNIPAWRSDHYGEVAIALQVCKFGIRNGLPMKEYYKTREYAPSVYPWVGIEDPHTAFYKWMILRNYRAMEYAKSRPEWNGRLMLLNGESLGGAQSLIMGALDPDVNFVSSCVPALCDHNACLAGRIQNGYPQLWKPDRDGRLPEAMRKVSESARYFDAMNFCTLYRPGQEVSVGTGYTDTLCPPDGVIAAFNNIPAGVKKTLWLNPPAGHDAGNWHAGRRIFELLGKE